MIRHYSVFTIAVFSVLLCFSNAAAAWHDSEHIDEDHHSLHECDHASHQLSAALPNQLTLTEPLEVHASFSITRPILCQSQIIAAYAIRAPPSL